MARPRKPNERPAPGAGSGADDGKAVTGRRPAVARTRAADAPVADEVQGAPAAAGIAEAAVDAPSAAAEMTTLFDPRTLTDAVSAQIAGAAAMAERVGEQVSAGMAEVQQAAADLSASVVGQVGDVQQAAARMFVPGAGAAEAQGFAQAAAAMAPSALFPFGPNAFVMPGADPAAFASGMFGPQAFARHLSMMFGAVTGPAAPQADAVAAPAFDPMAFGFGGAMPALTQMADAIARIPGMDWLGWMRGAMPAPLRIDPQRLSDLQAEYVERIKELMQLAASGEAPELKDRRFSDDAWREQNQPWGWTAALYLVNAEFLRRTAALLEGDPKTVERVSFAVGQWCDALAPSNFLATNPEVHRRIVESKGASLRQGIDNLLGDLHKGRISMTDETAFEVGRNVATTPGAVVYQSELFQLLQYNATTDKVGTLPLLMVPPCINKFYILDLQPDNSMIAHAISKGHTVFVVSWRNPGAEQGSLTWDDYLERGVIEAIRVTREICGVEQINTLGFCVGGTLLTTALAALEARGEKPAASLTLMTTLLDFGDPGVLGIFIDEAVVAFREQQMGRGGLMSGRDMAATFSFLRPNDLVWNYVVGNYLKGEEPPPFDLLYWNGDSTNLPGPMYVWYLRHMYLRNQLCKPGALSCLGQPIDLGRLDMPTYLFAAREDHIVPWEAAYRSTQLLGGPIRFTLGASGHIAGAINSAIKNRRSHWVAPFDEASASEYPTSHADWFAESTEVKGSWWNDWTHWLEGHKGSLRAARGLGGGGHDVIEAAPGSYVKQRAA